MKEIEKGSCETCQSASQSKDSEPGAHATKKMPKSGSFLLLVGVDG